jgi:hypothetical protein
MTLQTPPSWLQAGSYPAQYDRLNQQALYATTGIIGSSSMAVTANSPAGMSVRVASGWAAVIGTTTSNMGAYTAYNDATVTLTITTADPTNPRIDLVCMTVRDAYYSGASNDVIYQVIAGTPAGSPVAPTLPANSITLATVAVGAAVTQINSGNITDTRVNTTTNLPTGDITEVQGGTGITVTNGTGPIPSVAIDATVATLTGSETLTNKTLTSPVIATPKISLTYSAKTASYTFVSGDEGNLFSMNNAATQQFNIPTDATFNFAIGTQFNVFWITGAGQPTIGAVTPGTTTVISTGATSATPELRVANSMATAMKIAANSWIVIGDIE